MKISISLKQYLENKIAPIYNKIGGGHSIEHIHHVLKFANKLTNYYEKKLSNFNSNIILASVYYHDLGLLKDTVTHHHISKQIVLKDKNLKTWFTNIEIKLMADAVEDHRASSNKTPRTVYGKILADADNSDAIDIDILIKRMIEYRLKKDFTNKDKIIEDSYNHAKAKFGVGGYAKFYLQYTKKLLSKKIIESKKIISNKEMYRKRFNIIWNKIRN